MKKSVFVVAAVTALALTGVAHAQTKEKTGSYQTKNGTTVNYDRSVTKNADGTRAVNVQNTTSTGKTFSHSGTITKTDTGYTNTGTYTNGKGQTGTYNNTTTKTDTGFQRTQNFTNAQGETKTRTVTGVKNSDGTVTRTITGANGQTRTVPGTPRRR